MVKWILILIILLSAGCSKVQMSAEYQEEFEAATVRCAELNRRCQDGDDLACKEGLRLASETLNLLIDAVHGREPNDVD